MAVMGWFLLIRPARQNKKLRADMMAQLQEGAEILSVGGIYGTVVELRDEDLDASARAEVDDALKRLSAKGDGE